MNKNEKAVLTAVKIAMYTPQSREVYVKGKAQATIVEKFFNSLEPMAVDVGNWEFAYRITKVSYKREDMLDGKVRFTFFDKKDSWKFED